MEIVIATRNERKLEEIRRIGRGWAVAFLSLDDFPGCPQVEEDGETFEANALKKALAVSRWTGKRAVADDSGLEVDALGGAPGVRSARYAGLHSNDRENLEKLLKELRSVEGEQRGARFVCCVAFVAPGGSVKTFGGVVRGRIGAAPRGENGFGYDPVFYPEGHLRTFAEMSDAEKDAISHRGKALRELGQDLRTGG